METIINLDQELFFLLNGIHASWLDPIIFHLTQAYTSIPIYLFLIYLIIKNYKRQSWMVILAVLLVILFADQITSTFMKPFFERLRPTHEPGFEGLVHTVNGYRGGKFSFSSGHAANTFGIATFVFLLFTKRLRYMWLIFLWAATISYTRIYLGVHYPGDILIGASIGILLGWIFYRILSLILDRLEKRTALSG